MSYYTGRTLGGSTLDDIMTKCLPFADIPFCWQTLNGFSTDHLSTPEPYLHEVGSYQNHCNAFIPPPVDQDNPRLLPDETDLILPPSGFTILADVPPDSSNFSIHEQLSPLQLTDPYPQTHDTFLDPQTHMLLGPEPSSQEFTPALLPNAGLSYQLNGAAYLNTLPRTEISGSILLGNFDPQGVVDGFVPNAAKQVAPQRETAQMNPVLATIETHNIDEMNGANLRKFPSTFEISNIQSVEVTKPRMRWTPELHECFVQAVNHLGGPDRTTPRSILIKMGVDGLTLDHIKSHLQKYRIARFHQEAKDDKTTSCSEGKKRNSKFSKASSKDSGTLQMQWELQKTLHDQLKIIRELQMQAEETGRRLQEFMKNQDRMQDAFVQATQSFSSMGKVNSVEEPSAEACTSEEDEELPNNSHTVENCFVESNVELNRPFRKRPRFDT